MEDDPRPVLDPHIDAARRAGAADLGRHYAQGALSTSTFELRLETVLDADSERSVREVLWDLVPASARMRVDGLAVVAGGSGRVASAELRGVWLLGRGEACDLQVRDPFASRVHARVAKRGTAWTVEDLASQNGTWLNGRRIDRATLLPGDVLGLGGSRAHVRVDGHLPRWRTLLDRR